MYLELKKILKSQNQFHGLVMNSQISWCHHIYINKRQYNVDVSVNMKRETNCV